MAKKPQKRTVLPQPIKAWAGVVMDKLHHWNPGNGNYYEIYTSRKAAKKCYERVVRVKIIPQKD